MAMTPDELKRLSFAMRYGGPGLHMSFWFRTAIQWEIKVNECNAVKVKIEDVTEILDKTIDVTFHEALMFVAARNRGDKRGMRLYEVIWSERDLRRRMGL